MSKKSTAPALSLAAALSAMAAYASTHADTLGETTHDIENGGTLVVQSFASHQSFAEAFYNVCDLEGKVKTAVSKRSDSMKAKVTQFRAAVLTLESGETIQKIGATVLNEKGEAIAKEIQAVPTFFHDTDPLSLLQVGNQWALNVNYQLKPKPLTLAQLIESHPKLTAFAEIEGLSLKPASKESVVVSFETSEAYSAYWIAVSNLMPADAIKSAGDIVRWRMKGTDFAPTPLGRDQFYQAFSGRFDDVESAATLLLV